MPDRLPPLTALRAFEAAARHMSFARAAEELSVTPAALSFQIKSLEDHLGAPVFRRLNRAVELTEAGRALAPGASEGFETLYSAWRAARRAGDPNHLTVTSGPGFTSLWLAPRLFAFSTAHPDIELRVSASLRILDFNRDEIDLAIRWGSGTYAGLYICELTDDWATPMATPALAETLSRPEDLAHHTLLIDETTERVDPTIGWPAWFKAAGLDPPGQPTASFNTPDLAVRAALAGAGVLMGRMSLTEGAVRDGQLVMPFGLTLWSAKSYRVFCPAGHESRPHIQAFLAWLHNEMENIKNLTGTRQFAPRPV